MVISPTITPSTDPKLKEKLVKKLEEYRLRKAGKGTVWEYAAPSAAHMLYLDYRDALYKFEILTEVLKSKKPVNTFDISTKMAKRFGRNFDVVTFNVAASVISAYCGDTKNKLSGGTGLK